MKKPFDATFSAFCEKYSLSPREREVASAIISGMSPAHISEHLKISPNTIRIHIKNINFKVSVQSKTAFVAKFLSFIMDELCDERRDALVHVCNFCGQCVMGCQATLHNARAAT